MIDLIIKKCKWNYVKDQNIPEKYFDEFNEINNKFDPKWLTYHQEMRRQKFLSRYALFLNLEKKISWPEISQYHYEKNNFPISLSHTKNFGFSIIGQNLDFGTFSIGIDGESANRVIKNEVLPFFMSSLDQTIELTEEKNITALGIWTMKEAAFKCIYHFLRIKIPLKSISIKYEPHTKNIYFEFQVNENKFSGRIIHEQIIENNLIISKAFII